MTETKKHNNRIYISGAITGTTDYIERFAIVEKRLREMGFDVINPAAISEMLPALEHDEHMTIDFALMAVCDNIYILKGSEKSEGVRQEVEYAELTGMMIWREV